MDRYKYNILIFSVLFVLVSVFTFANKRNNTRKLTTDKIIFTQKDNLLISEDSVNKLLIQKSKLGSISTKETLALDSVETRLRTIPHIKDAQVYVSVSGLISTNITPRKAVGRIYSARPRYIDETGFEMPLSTQFSERVPLVFNFKPTHKDDLIVLLKKIDAMPFLKPLVVGVYCEADLKFRLKIRDYNGIIELGTLKNMDLKIQNFKGFYAKAIKDKLFEKYKKINLEITNQVVCTK